MIGDVTTAWFTLLLGLSGSGAIFTVVARFIRGASGGLR